MVDEEALEEPAVAAGVLVGEVVSFGDTAERLIEVLLVVVVGISSLYYVSYALRHGVTGSAATDAVRLSLTVVALSVIVHGVTAAPILARYERSLNAARGVR